MRNESQTSGWVYVAQTPSLPNLVKVGYSIVSLERRMREISRYVPESYSIVHAVWVNNPKNVEWLLHQHFSTDRVEGKEFFTTQPAKIVEVLRVIAEVAGTTNITPTQSTVQTKQHGRLGKTKEFKTSKHKGVDFHKASGKYRARLAIGGQQFFLGSYDDEDTAAKVVSQFRSSIGL